jgi:hypothetical protein
VEKSKRTGVALSPLAAKSRTHLKNIFWPNIFVGAWFKILRDLEPKSYF